MKPCRICGVRPRVVVVTDITGRASYPEEPCKHEVRLAARQCCECGRPHGGDHRTRRCAPCRDEHERRADVLIQQRYRSTPKGRAAVKRYVHSPEHKARKHAIDKVRYRNLPSDQRERRAEYHRKRYSLLNSPKREERLAYLRAWRAKRKQEGAQ